MRKLSVLFLAFLMLSFTRVSAQTEQFSLSELDPYISAYMKPFANAMSVGMSGGWTHTAEVHKKFGFDLTFSASVVNVPSSGLTFDVNSLDMPGYSFDGPQTAPTISADANQPAPDIYRSFATAGIPQLNFPGIEGLGVNYGGMAAIQASFGLPYGTDIIGRYIPDISKTTNRIIPDDVQLQMEKTGMWGFGLKHDIKQWIPVVKKVPFLQISGLLTFSKLYTGFSGADMQVTPDRIGATSIAPEYDTPETWDDQRFDIKVGSFTGSLLVGASIPVFQPFIGIGYNRSNFDAGLLGTYPVISVDANPLDYFPVNSVEEDPLVAEGGVSNFNFQAGARLKLGPIVFYYQMTMQDYTMHTGGLAVTVR